MQLTRPCQDAIVDVVVVAAAVAAAVVGILIYRFKFLCLRRCACSLCCLQFRGF